MLMLLCAVTTWAGPTDLPQITTDLEHPIYYTISNTRSASGKLLYYTESGVKDATPQVLTDAYKFFFTGSSLSDVKIHNAEAEKSGLLFTGTGAWNATGVSCEICVTPFGDGTTGLAIKFSDTSLNEQNYDNGYTTWSANDGGSIYVMDLVEDIDWPEVGKFYTIEAPLFENVQGVKKGLQVDANGSLGWNTIDLTNKNCYWTVEYSSENGGYAVKNLGTDTYLNGTTMSEAVANYAKFNYLSQCQFNIVVNGTTIHANNHGGGSNAGSNIVSWGGGIGSASAWQFVEQQDPDAVQPIEITYNFTYNGQPLDGYTQTVNTVTGTEYPNITVSFPFGVSATKPEGTIAKEDAPAKTVTIAVKENLPFKYAADANSIKNWYYIQQHSSAGYGKYLQYAETYIEWADATMTAGEADTYTWAFVGDPFAGFKMVNYGAPEGANAVVSNGSGNPSFGTFADATAWNIKASRVNNDAEHFCFQYPGSNQYMNAQSGKIAFWGDSDQGSTMWVTERDLTGKADLQALIDQVDAAIAVYGEGGTTVGYYTAESAAALAAALAAAKEAVVSENSTLESNTAAKVALQNAVAALAVIQPAEGKFYTISNCKNDHRANQQIYVNNDGGMQFAHVDHNKANGSIGHVFQFVPAGNNKFYLYNVQRGTYLSTVQGHGWGQNLALATENPSVMVTLAHTGTANIVYITPENSEMVGAKLHAQDSGSSVVGWDANGANDASAWVISEVTDITALSHELTVGDAGYATLCLGYNATIPTLDGEECGVYTAAVVDGYAAMTKVEGVLPANTAVIVKATAGTYEFNYATGEVSAIENNELKGTTVNKNFTDAAYVLGVVEGEVGLYTAANNVSTDTTNDDPEVTYEAWKNNAFKAYLPKATGMNAVSYSFRFEGEGTTSISEVKGENGEVKTIYDLTGRRVEAITAPGIYIVNGVKRVVR